MGYSKRLGTLHLAFMCVLSFYKLVTVRLTCKTLPNKTNVSVLTGIRLCLVVTFHTITRALLFFFFPLTSFHHCSSVSGKKHVGQNVNTNTWYESQRCKMKELQHKITHIFCGIIFRLNKHDCIMDQSRLHHPERWLICSVCEFLRWKFGTDNELKGAGNHLLSHCEVKNDRVRNILFCFCYRVIQRWNRISI